MLRISAAVRQIAIALLALVVMVGPSQAQTPSGDIRMEIVSGGFIVGLAGGDGVLTYRGRQYPLRIAGASIGVVIGAARANLAGQVYNLRRPSDIYGNYTAVDAGYAIARGRKTVRLTNSRGVALVLRGRQIGLEASLDLSGLQISPR
jgi:hypothetical protein